MPSDQADLLSKHALGIDPAGWLFLQDPIWVFDLRSNRVVWANDAALTFWHAENPGELYARDMAAQSDVARARLAEYAARFALGETIEATWTLYPKGECEIVRCLCRGVPLADGRTAMLVHAIDVGDQLRAGNPPVGSSDDLREARDQLARTEARFRAFAQAGSDWLWESDDALRITYLSLGANDHFGVPADQAIGLTRHEIFANIGVYGDTRESREHWRKHAADLAAHRSFREFEYAYRAEAGGIRHASISGDPVFSETGRFLGYRGVGRDITRRVEAEDFAREMRRERDVALTANSVSNQLLATMSHELRTPLNAIIGFSEVMFRELMGPMQNETYRDYAHVVFDSAKHLLGIVDDLLNVSRSDFGQQALDVERIEADGFLEDLVRMTSHLAQQRDLRLEYAVGEDGLSFAADRRGMRQVLLNLISNAIKFSPAGSAIGVSCRRAGDGLIELSVQDDGDGIDSSDIPHVFEPFRSVNPLVARESGGVGLGLWISKRIVEAHGGEIVIDSVSNAGTTVTVRLPQGGEIV